MLPPLDLHFDLLAACLNSKWCGSKLAHGLQTGTVFSGVKRPECEVDHMHLLAKFYTYVE